MTTTLNRGGTGAKSCAVGMDHVKGGRYVSGVYDLVAGQGAPTS